MITPEDVNQKLEPKKVDSIPFKNPEKVMVRLNREQRRDRDFKRKQWKKN